LVVSDVEATEVSDAVGFADASVGVMTDEALVDTVPDETDAVVASVDEVETAAEPQDEVTNNSAIIERASILFLFISIPPKQEIRYGFPLVHYTKSKRQCGFIFESEYAIL
jgi:hypothetical protein